MSRSQAGSCGRRTAAWPLLDPAGEAHWTIDALSRAARDAASPWLAARCGAACGPRACVGASPGRGATSTDPESAPKGRPSSTLYTTPPGDATVVCVDELDPVSPRTHPPAPVGAPDGHQLKAPVEYGRGRDKARKAPPGSISKSRGGGCSVAKRLSDRPSPMAR